MSRVNELQNEHLPRRSSMFIIPIGRRSFQQTSGSSHISFIHGPLDSEDNFQDEYRKQKKAHYENTYQMGPIEKFRAAQVSEIIQEVLNTTLAETTYEPNACGTLSKTIAQDIKLRVKELDFKRYKLISLVTIGEKKDQGVRVGSRCVWDKETDNFATAMFENTSIYAVGMLYAVYYE